jgi:ABC-type branched-subunit amino acid transport system substrate-binding protein
MQPAQAEGGGSSSNNLKKWGPIGAIVLVVAAIIGIVVVTGGDDDGGDAGADTTTAVTEPAASDTTESTAPTGSEPTDSQPEGTEPDGGGGGEITYPLSFSQAQEQGIEVAWDERCDTERGTLAVRDYFAPECYAPFEGDNGGATSRGVTADTIKVVLYQGPDEDPIINYLSDAVAVDDTNAESEQTARDMLEMYQAYYEFYGRALELETYVSTGLANDEVTARADAVRIAEDYEPFVVLGGPALTSAFADELAARQVMCIGCTPGQPPEWYAERDPYVWGLAIGARQARAHAQEFISKQLIGGNAVHAGDEAFQTQPRRFGHVYISSSPESETIATEFVDALRAEGADLAEVLPYTLDPTTIQSQASQIIAKLKASGVTSVILAADGIAPREFTREATDQEYFPEWVIVAPALADLTAFGRTYDQEQWAHAFGVTHGAARVTPEISGYYALYQWWKGTEPPAKDTIGLLMPNFALLTAVLQGTGPNLTPETWRDALFAADGTVAAISQPYLKWGDTGIWPYTDYSGVDDATLIWWDPTATGPDEIRKDGTGMYQFVDGGTRFLPGEWPSEDRLFDPEGAVAIYEIAPPGEAPPDYPSPAGG